MQNNYIYLQNILTLKQQQSKKTKGIHVDGLV